MVEFLPDCTHDLAGETVELENVGWMVKNFDAEGK